jgi:pentapeptide MXKDX repeat protein
MKSTICKLMAMCFLATSLVAFAQSSSGSQDEMKKDDAMKQDSMKNHDMSKADIDKQARKSNRTR